MVSPIRTRPRFPHISPSHLEASTSLLSLSIQRTDRMKITITKITKLITWITALSNSMKYEPYRVEPPKTDRSWWRILTKCGPLEKGMAKHFDILTLGTP